MLKQMAESKHDEVGGNTKAVAPRTTQEGVCAGSATLHSE